MSVKNILVAYNGTESSDAALDAALLMHGKYACHITGIYAHSSRIERLQDQSWVPDNISALIGGLVKDDEARLKQTFFARLADRVRDDHVHWVSHTGRPDATVAEYARLFDISLVGRHDSVIANREVDLHPDRIALKSGRPVLVIPRGWAPERINEHAVIAWDGQRAAARALSEAMQILETKQLVTILTVSDRNLGAPLPGIDVQTALARHGVNVQTQAIDQGTGGIGAAILAHCEAIGAGLLVMGAYERSVFREELLGGTTKTIVENATLPVLIAH